MQMYETSFRVRTVERRTKSGRKKRKLDEEWIN